MPCPSPWHIPTKFLNSPLYKLFSFPFCFAFPSLCSPPLGLPLQYLVTSHSRDLLFRVLPLSLLPFFLVFSLTPVRSRCVLAGPLGGLCLPLGPGRLHGADRTESEQKTSGSLCVAVAFLERVSLRGDDITVQFFPSFS